MKLSFTQEAHISCQDKEECHITVDKIRHDIQSRNGMDVICRRVLGCNIVSNDVIYSMRRNNRYVMFDMVNYLTSTPTLILHGYLSNYRVKFVPFWKVSTDKNTYAYLDISRNILTVESLTGGYCKIDRY